MNNNLVEAVQEMVAQQQTIQAREKAVGEAAALLQRALTLLSGGKPSVVVNNGLKRERKGYIAAMCDIVEKNGGKPMMPAAVRDEMMKMEAFKNIPASKLRDLLDRQLWAETRKNNPRLKKTKDGYVLTAEARRKSA